MKFLPIFTLRVTHSYYADGRCPDFSIEPNPTTEKLLKNHRCAFRSFPDGIRVFMQVDDEEKPSIAYPEQIAFTFHLRLLKPDFTLFTDLSDIANQPAPLYTNTGPNTAGDKILLLGSRKAWFTESFIIEHPAQENRFILSGRPLAGLAANKLDIMDSGNVELKKYDEANKIVSVDTHNALRDETFAIKYPIAPRLEKGVFADVEIHGNSTLQPVEEGSAEFQIAFKARQARWKYYLVTDLKNAEEEFHIAELKFSHTNLTESPDSSDGLAKELAQRYPDLQILRFVSDDSIFCRQTARRNLKLRFDGRTLFEALPNPSLRNYSKDAFSHVVKCITKLFP